ncbi:hypothetical protein [Rhodopseudomonas telluris]|uniref:Uncharacterized protein n=1 Tax=Rhodopseudomonas telluris TaxID=644215 RepID=A0ABV6EQN8_9BRAD
MSPSAKPRAGRPVSTESGAQAKAVSIDALASTINRAIEQAEDLGISSAVQLLMMARLEVDLTEIALETKLKKSA